MLRALSTVAIVLCPAPIPGTDAGDELPDAATPPAVPFEWPTEGGGWASFRSVVDAIQD